MGIYGFAHFITPKGKSEKEKVLSINSNGFYYIVCALNPQVFQKLIYLCLTSEIFVYKVCV